MKAKKIIIAFFLVGLTAVCYSQESAKKSNQSDGGIKTSSSTQMIKDTWNGIKDAYMSGEALEAQQKFCYGLLKQGATTASGIGESLYELPENLFEAVSEYEDAVGSPIETMCYFGRYSLESIWESMANIYYNYTSGDPERIGAATFDIGLTVATAKGNSRIAINRANKYGPKYHYTYKKYIESIKKEGIKVNKEGEAFATYDGTLSGSEAKSQLALRHEGFPDMRIKVDNSVKPQEIRPVKPNYNQPGGGVEQVFHQDIPASKLISFDPIPQNPTLKTIATRVASKSLNYFTSYAFVSYMETVSEQDAMHKIDNEGGHTIEARISTIVYVDDDNIEPGETMLFGIDGTFLLGINSKDIDKVTPEFLSKISDLNGGAILPDPKPKRSRNDVIPEGTRTQRGL